MNPLVNRLLALGAVGVVAEVAAREVEHSGGAEGAVDALRAFVTLTTAALLLHLYVLYALEWTVERIRVPSLDAEEVWAPVHAAAFVLEAAVCAVHAPPFVRVDVDVSLSGGAAPNAVVRNPWTLLMVLRLWMLTRLVGRFYPRTAVSGIFADTQLGRGALLRSVVSGAPVLVLLSMLLAVFVSASYSMLVCERGTEGAVAGAPCGVSPGRPCPFGSDTPTTMGDSAWLVAMTTLLVGYGDVAPHTGCGRVVSSVAALCGAVGITVLMTSIHNAMYLNPHESRVAEFLASSRQALELRTRAATLVQRAWRDRVQRLESRALQRVGTVRQLLGVACAVAVAAAAERFRECRLAPLYVAGDNNIRRHLEDVGAETSTFDASRRVLGAALKRTVADAQQLRRTVDRHRRRESRGSSAGPDSCKSPVPRKRRRPASGVMSPRRSLVRRSLTSSSPPTAPADVRQQHAVPRSPRARRSEQQGGQRCAPSAAHGREGLRNSLRRASTFAADVLRTASLMSERSVGLGAAPGWSGGGYGGADGCGGPLEQDLDDYVALGERAEALQATLNDVRAALLRT